MRNLSWYSWIWPKIACQHTCGATGHSHSSQSGWTVTSQSESHFCHFCWRKRNSVTRSSETFLKDISTTLLLVSSQQDSWVPFGTDFGYSRRLELVHAAAKQLWRTLGPMKDLVCEECAIPTRWHKSKGVKRRVDQLQVFKVCFPWLAPHWLSLSIYMGVSFRTSRSCALAKGVTSWGWGIWCAWCLAPLKERHAFWNRFCIGTYIEKIIPLSRLVCWMLFWFVFGLLGNLKPNLGCDAFLRGVAPAQENQGIEPKKSLSVNWSVMCCKTWTSLLPTARKAERRRSNRSLVCIRKMNIQNINQISGLFRVLHERCNPKYPFASALLCGTVTRSYTLQCLSAAVAVWYWFAPVSASVRLGWTKPLFYPCSSDHRLESQWVQTPLGVLYKLHMVSFFSSALMMKKWHMKLQ